MSRRQPGSEPGRQTALEEMLAAFNSLRFAVLATSDNGRPYTSLIAFALSPKCKTLIFPTPRTTRKYRNIKNQPAVSILLDNRSQLPDDLQSAQAVTLLGTAKEVKAAAQNAQYRLVFVNKHPELAAFLDRPDTAIIAVTIRQAVHVARFQDVSSWP